MITYECVLADTTVLLVVQEIRAVTLKPVRLLPDGAVAPGRLWLQICWRNIPGKDAVIEHQLTDKEARRIYADLQALLAQVPDNAAVPGGR